MELFEGRPVAATPSNGPRGTRPWRPLRLVRQPLSEGAAVMREILEALAVAQRSLAACPAEGAELAHLEARVATLQVLYRDLFSTPGVRGSATATRARLHAVGRASGS